MRRSIALSIALAVSVISLSLMISDSTARAQQQRRQRFRADTGLVTLGPNQVLRLTAEWDLDNDGAALVGFRRFDYVQANCIGSVCKHFTANPNPAGEPQELELMPGEAASMDITPTPNSSGVRVVVASNRQNVRVVFHIIDASTGDIIAIWVPQGSPAVGNQ